MSIESDTVYKQILEQVVKITTAAETMQNAYGIIVNLVQDLEINHPARAELRDLANKIFSINPIKFLRLLK